MKAVFLDRATIDASVSLAPICEQVEELIEFDATKPEQLIEHALDAEILLTNKVVLDAEAFAQLPKLKLICVCATGTNNIDLQAAKEAGVTVKNVAGYSTTSVAQHLFTYLLNSLSRVPDYLQLRHTHPWYQSEQFCQIDFPIEELAGKTLGIFGYGNLGQAVGRIARAFDMQVLVSERPGAKVIRTGRVEFEQMLSSADIVTLHCPLDESTFQLFNQATLQKLKPGAILINTARGPIVDSFALVQLLRSGHLSHAIVDVLEQEPPSADHPLLQRDVPNLTLTSHIAWGSLQAQRRLMKGVAKNIEDYLQE